MFNSIDIYSFIPESGCLGIGPSALLCPGGYDAVRTVLMSELQKYFKIIFHSVITFYFLFIFSIKSCSDFTSQLVIQHLLHVKQNILEIVSKSNRKSDPIV